MLQAFTVEEVAERLRLNPRTVYRMIEKGQLHGVRAGRLWRVPEDSLRDYLEGEAPQESKQNKR